MTEPNSSIVEQLKNQLDQYNQILSDLNKTIEEIESQKNLVIEKLKSLVENYE